LHYAADLLTETLDLKTPPIGPAIKVLDIGTGANCIYPILGSHEYGWSFVGTEVDAGAYASAKTILAKNPRLKTRLELRLQEKPQNILKGVVSAEESYHLTICNPPFHVSESEANAVNEKKWRNLGKSAVANFGGRSHELWCEGGEVAFIGRLIEESRVFPKLALWFTAFVSKEINLGEIYGKLRSAKVKEWRTVEMAQGQKKSRFVAWTFI
jgi:23S rRNA (adenine1618-N6)-methyltransferase